MHSTLKHTKIQHVLSRLLVIRTARGSYGQLIWSRDLHQEPLMANHWKVWVLPSSDSIVPSSVFGEAPVVGLKPLGLPASGKVHTWLPWPTQRTPSPGILASLPNIEFRQPCRVRGALEAVAGAVETFATSFAGSSWPQPASPPSALKLL
eukprot:1150927-Pelagomonas_calceolata.AAC.3